MEHAGELAALGTAACWVATALSFEAAGRRVGSLTVNLVRLVLAIGLLAAANALRRGLPLPTDATAHAWLWLSVSGLVGFTFGDLCLFRAFVVLGARLSTLVMSLVPPLTAAIGWAVLGEVLAPRDLAGMALTVAGIAWAVAERRPPTAGPAPLPAGTGPVPAGAGLPAGSSAKTPDRGRAATPTPGDVPSPAAPRTGRAAGIALAVGGALGQAGGLVLSKLGMGTYDPWAATEIRVLAGTAGYLLLFTALRRWGRVRSALADRRAMAFTSLGAFFGPFLGVSLSLVAVQLVPAGVAASLMATTPILILPAAALLHGERIGPGAAGGAVLAVAGVGLLLL